MKTETRTLLDAMVDHCILEYSMEQKFLALLQEELIDASPEKRDELICYIEDRLIMHPNRPSKLHTSYDHIKTYVDKRLQLAGWKERLQEWRDQEQLLWDELNEITENYGSLMADLDIDIKEDK